MDNLTKTQLVLLTLLVSFFTSLVTGIVTVTLVAQAPPPITETIHRVVEKTVEKVQEAKPEQAAAASEAKKNASETVRVITQEQLVVEIVKNIAPAVGSIVATKDVPVLERVFVNPFGDSPVKDMLPPELLQDFLIPQLRQKGTQKQEISSGTGFFVSADGFIITNRHVVADTSADFTFILNDGVKLPVDVLARDPAHDLAVLKVKTPGAHPYITLGDSHAIRVGQTVIAIGNALGEFRNTVSVGVISGLQRTITAFGGGAPETLQGVIQTDAAINPGNSGGPLLNLEGRVIGINTAVAQGAENVGFALPADLLKKDLADVREFGAIRYPFLGVRYVMLNERLKTERKLPIDYGALLLSGPSGEPAVLPNSPAAKAGLAEGDIILEFGGERVDAEHMLAELILKHAVGQTLTIKVRRGNDVLALSAVLVDHPDE